MSRIGKKEINIPANTTVTVGSGEVTVKGPLGTLSKKVVPNVSIENTGTIVKVTPRGNSVQDRALWGTYASHIINMIQGVNEKYKKQLEIIGVGYRVELRGNTLVLNLGFSHQVHLTAPEGIDLHVEKNTIIVSGIDKETVGQFAAVVRSHKKPEPYKGKGIRYQGEEIIRKEGKKKS